MESRQKDEPVVAAARESAEVGSSAEAEAAQ